MGTRFRFLSLLAGLFLSFTVVVGAQPTWESAIPKIQKDPAYLETFLEKRDISAPEGNGWSLIHWAAHLGNTKVLRQLIAKGADINQRTSYPAVVEMDELMKGLEAPTCPVVLAARAGRAGAVKVLIEAGVNLKGDIGDGALQGVVAHDSRDRAEIVTMLVKSGVAPRGRAFQACVGRNHYRCLDAFLANGANVNKLEAESGGLSPLFKAVSLNDPKMLKVILKYRPDLNAKINQVELISLSWVGDQHTFLSEGQQERTALMVAATNDSLDVAKLLVEAGANVSIRDGGGRTALDLARQRKARRVEKYLSSRTAK